MFTTKEKEHLELLLSLPNFCKFYKENNRQIQFFDFKDLMNGDEYLNSLELCGNATISTDFPFYELMDIFEFDKSKVQQDTSVLKDEKYSNFYIYSKHSNILKDEDLQFQEFFMKNEYLKLFDEDDEETREYMIREVSGILVGDVEIALGQKFKTRITQPGACLSLNKNGVLKPLFDKIFVEDRCLYVSNASLREDYTGNNAASIIINGIDKNPEIRAFYFDRLNK